MTKIITKKVNELLGTDETSVRLYTKDGMVEYYIKTYEFNQFVMSFINTYSLIEMNNLLSSHGGKIVHDNMDIDRKMFIMRG